MTTDRLYEAIVLSGGGLKGFGLLGGLQYMVDSKRFVDDVLFYSGTSIGAVICYFLAIGYTPIEMTVYSITNKIFDTYERKSIDSVLSGEGLYDFSVFQTHLENMSIDKIGYMPTLLELFEKFGKTLYTCSYNITQRRKEYFSYHNHPDMLCSDAIRLSCSLPFIFNDCIYNGDCYIDGGFVDNCPFGIIDQTIPAIIFNIGQKDTEDSYKKVIDKFYTILTIPMIELQQLKLQTVSQQCKIIELELEPKLYEFNMSHTDKLELFSIGYNTTKLLLQIN